MGKGSHIRRLLKGSPAKDVVGVRVASIGTGSSCLDSWSRCVMALELTKAL